MKEKAKRNEEIARAVLNGTLLRVVASKYGVSKERVRQLVDKYCKHSNRVIYAELLDVHKGSMPLYRLRELRKFF